MGRKKNSDGDVARSGDLLVEQFRSALLTRSAVLQAQSMAEQTEAAALQSIAAIPNGSHAYVLPADIPPEQASNLSRTSLDAHLQKVQSVQISQHGEAFLAQLQHDVTEQYKGRKVQVRVLDAAETPVEQYWRSPQTGAYVLGTAHPRSITGVIEEIRLAENALILKPRLSRQLINNRLAYYVVYIINPTNLECIIPVS
jgi:hypothetical protein